MSTPRLPGPWPASLTTRKCRKPDTCEHASSWHTHHLTWLGRWKYAGVKPAFLRFPRLHQVMVLVMAAFVIWDLIVFATSGGHDWFVIAAAVVDAALACLWWHWGVREVKHQDRMAAFRARIRGDLR